MKSLFEQFGGTYRKENDYVIPNLEMPDIANFEIGIYGQRHLYFLQHYRYPLGLLGKIICKLAEVSLPAFQIAL